MHFNTIKQFLNYLKENSEVFSSQQAEKIHQMANAQHPKITLVTCSDSRLDMEFFRIDPLDTVFTIRNIWNTILANEWSVEYGVEHLETPILLILWHTNCGAVKAGLKDYHHCSPAIKRELNHLEAALSEVDKNADFHKQWVEWVKKNLDLQLEIAYEKFKSRVEEGKLAIVGAILDLDNSLGEGHGKLHTYKILVKDDHMEFDISTRILI